MDREFLLRMSYMEIYNEEINDLLAPEHRKLQIHENLEVFSLLLICFYPEHVLILCSPAILQSSVFNFFESEGYLLLGWKKKLSRPLNKFLISWSLENVCLCFTPFHPSCFIYSLYPIIALTLLKHAAHRHIGETNMNVYSSRSHTIFRMVHLLLIFLCLMKIKLFRFIICKYNCR